jgi:hypothetical protein
MRTTDLREIVFESRLVGRIFGPRREKLTGRWRKLHYKKLPDLYTSTDIRI